MLEEPARYLPAAGAAVECTLCRQCIARLRCGDRALRELVELRLLIGTADAA
jgi:hypothetical protein